MMPIYQKRSLRRHHSATLKAVWETSGTYLCALGDSLRFWEGAYECVLGEQTGPQSSR